MKLVMPGMVARQRSAAAVSAYPLQSPIGGLNTRDSLSDMQGRDAITLVNLFPDVGGLRSRKGHSSFATGFSSYVETIAQYSGASSTVMIAASSSMVYTVPDTGGTPTAIGTGFASGRWQTQNFNNRLLMVNGADAPQTYDGSTLAASGWTGSGLTPSNLVGINIFKGRVFAWERESADFWYGSPGAITGTLTKFFLAQIAHKGGYLVAMETWTRDGGSGPDDYAVFFMSTGEVIMYPGSDPGDAAEWSLVGRFDIGAPLGVRSVTRYGGDIYVITKADFVPFTVLLQNGGKQSKLSKLSGAAADAARSYATNTGWQAVLYPRGNMVLFNIPVVSNQQYVQYGFNTVTGAGFKFEGWNGSCFGVYRDRLYFGGNQAIYLADDGLRDNGAAIRVEGRQAFNYLGNQGSKRIKAISPSLKVDGSVAVTLGLSFDYGRAEYSQAVTTVEPGPAWDTSDWDTTYWGSENQVVNPIVTAGGTGQAVSIRLAASLNNQALTWHRTRLNYERLDRF